MTSTEIIEYMLERKNKMQTNIIYNTDCLALKGGIIDLPNKSIDLVVTDPPYKFENQGGGFYAKKQINTKNVFRFFKTNWLL